MLGMKSCVPICIWSALLQTSQSCSGSSLQLDPAYCAANHNKAKKDLGRLPAIVQLAYTFVSCSKKLEKHPVAFLILMRPISWLDCDSSAFLSFLVTDGVSHEPKNRRRGAVNQGCKREKGGFMRVYRPSSLLMRKDSNSLLDTKKREREGGVWEVEDECSGGKERKWARKRDKGKR